MCRNRRSAVGFADDHNGPVIMRQLGQSMLQFAQGQVYRPFDVSERADELVMTRIRTLSPASENAFRDCPIWARSGQRKHCSRLQRSSGVVGAPANIIADGVT